MMCLRLTHVAIVSAACSLTVALPMVFGFAIVGPPDTFPPSRRRTLVTLSAENESGGLSAAGRALMSASTSRESFNEKESSFIQAAGQALISAGDNWTLSWTEVTIALEEAAQYFYELSDETKEQATADLYNRIAKELEDASNIGGCTSIGPPAAVPNLEIIRDSLVELAERHDNGSNPCKSLSTAANAIKTLIESYEE